MNLIIFRCDASLSIGSGHIMRCRTLARELKRRGAAIIFLCRRQPGCLIDLLEEEFSVLALPEQPLTACQGLGGRDLYSAWLGCSQDSDAAQCLKALTQAGITSASWVVTDHYGLDASWEGLFLAGLDLGDASPKLLVIDDLADRHHLADSLVDQNWYGDSTHDRYRNLVPVDCRQFLGPHYALLGPEYAELHNLVPPRNELRRVLVFFGGVDPYNLTISALEALNDSTLTNIAVDVVLGRQSECDASMIRICKRRNSITLHNPLQSLAGLIARADLCVGAGGATTWERFCLGCPSVSVTVADNQRELANALSQKGLIHAIDDSVKSYSEAILDAVKYFLDPKKLRAASELVRTYCEGKGASILAEQLIAQQP